MPEWTLTGSILLANAGGWASTLTMIGQVKSAENKAWYQNVKKPSWTPPNWLFGPVWTIIYTSMGYASYLVFKDCDGFSERAMVPLTLYGGQLILNWTWTPVFFGLHKIGLALAHMIALDAAATACTISFAGVNQSTLYFMVPYLCWLGFATCLNYSIWRQNIKNE